jgi:hypothetical protein
MNEQQPYEKHLVDKLQHLPPPGDINQSWEQMRSLLDKEMPRGGGMPGRRRWWIFGIAIGVLFLATWLSGDSLLNRKSPAVVAAGAPKQPAHDAGNTALSGPSATAHQPAHNDKDLAGGTVNATPAAGDNQPTVVDDSPDKSRGEPMVSVATRAPEKDEGNIAATPGRTNKTVNNNSNRNPKADEAITTLKNKPAGINAKNNAGKKATAGARQPGDGDVFNQRNQTTDKSHKGAKNADRILANRDPLYSQPAVERVRSTTVKAPLRYTDNEPAPVLYPAGTTIQQNYVFKNGLLPDHSAAKTVAAKKKVQRNREAGVLAAGLSLPLAFPLGDQRAMGYNFRAGHNTVSDYLPSPHLQYHFNSKTFIQTEAQVMAPQFISSILLYSHVTPMSGNYYNTNSIYAKKLYYFNVPVSIHYSPFTGFYLGTGLQFSSMLSGIALSEERKWSPGGSNVLVKEEYTRFRNDSLSQKINGNEFRLLLDANYYWNSFTVGLRYNQALTNYISFRLSPGMPYSFDKNRALQFYMRYNLWDNKKRGNNNSKTLLTLK